MTELHQLIDQLETHISHHEKSNNKVSQSTIGWQIEHSCRVIINIIEALKKSNPEEYQWRYNFKRTIVLVTNHIPRGVGKAPKSVQVEEKITNEMLEKSINKVWEKVNEWENIPSNCFFNHPYFGHLNKKITKKFLIIHTKHHLKIIKDISKL